MISDAYKVIIYTDHSETVDIVKQQNFKHATPQRQNLRLVRASLYLSQFQLDVRQIPGKQNVVADALSRLDTARSEDEERRLAQEEDIYEALHAEATMVHIADTSVDKFQEEYGKDRYLKGKWAELKRQYKNNRKRHSFSSLHPSTSSPLGPD
jgi:hypothetical protein